MIEAHLIACLIASSAIASSSASSAVATSSIAPSPIAPAPLFSAGLLAGEPIGVTAALVLSDRFAFHGELGPSTSQRTAWIGAIDFVYALTEVFGPIGAEGYLMPWFGAGAFYSVGKVPRDSSVPVDDVHDHFGVRVPFGISFVTRQVPIEVYVEIAPALGFIPNVLGPVQGGLGLRIALF